VSDDLNIPRNPVYRANRSRGPDRMTHRLLLIAGGLAGALVLIVVLWSSVGHHGGPTPVVQADQQPVRVKPVNPGGMQIPGLSADAGSGAGSGDGSAAADKLAPAPETPDPQGLASQMRTAAVPARPAAASTPPVAGAAERQATAAAPVTAKPTQVAGAMVPERRAALPGAHGSVGRTQVQLAAVTTEAAARHEWDRLAHRMPGVLGTHHPMFSKIEHDGQTLWRVRTGEFTTEAEASQFCHEVRAKGAGCAVATF
jgi:hypothetical protein